MFQIDEHDAFEVRASSTMDIAPLKYEAATMAFWFICGWDETVRSVVNVAPHRHGL
jgi:hypothetical protein